MQVQPYLSFDGRCEEAIEFYKKALAAEVTTLMRFRDNPAPTAECRPKPGTEHKIMHAALRIGDSTVMASDCQCEGKPKFEGFSLALTARDDAAAEKLFAALSDGGIVQMPLAKTFFSPRFGMVADKFGVMWMVIVGK